ncbi:MAG: glutamate synthase subunit beta [Alphaproteobacteria bacterium]
MGKPTGFLEIERHDRGYIKIPKRVKSWHEFVLPLPADEVSQQAARCMDCGVPFCHTGCPVNNLIPDWNNLVYRGSWRSALETLHSTNNFPEFTGRICPAPCEEACTLNINAKPVTIKTVECSIIDRGFAEGWVVPQPPLRKTGKKVAVIGSGPAGMACAQQLARAGHHVALFEKSDRIGGLLRYGIPDFKMEKHLIDRRMAQMAAEGVTFKTSAHVGVSVKVEDLLSAFDALVLSGGSEKPRDLPIPGRQLAGIHYAMEFLTQQNKRVAGDAAPASEKEGGIFATGRHTIVIGGGDTGSDCIGTSTRHGAAAITQLEIMPRPPDRENKDLVWPYWPLKYRTSSSQEEGCEREFAVATKEFVDDGKGRVGAIRCVHVEWRKGPDGRMTMADVPGSGFEIKADLVLLAMGFVHAVHEGMIKNLGIELDPAGNVKADTNKYQSSNPKVFAAGDMRRGQSLVVWAIREGRQCARAVDEYLCGSSDLPR